MWPVFAWYGVLFMDLGLGIKLNAVDLKLLYTATGFKRHAKR